MNYPGTHPNTGYDHPMQPGFLSAGRDEEIEHQINSELTQRYIATATNPAEVIDAFNMWRMRNDSYRHTHEIGNSQKIIIDTESARQYADLAGDVGRLGVYMGWISMNARPLLASLAFQHHKIALEAVGQRHPTLWDATHEVEAIIKTVPNQIQSAHPTAIVKNLVADGLAAPSRVFLPKIELDDMIREEKQVRSATRVSGMKLNNGLLRIRTPQFDALFPQDKQLEIYEERTFMIVYDQLPPEEQKMILKEVRAHGPDYFEQPGTVSSDVAGEAVDRALQSEDGETTDVIPISTHYVAVARRTSRAKH